MKGDIPECTRCCFFLPLRYGLLAWGYFKMIADALLISLMIFRIISLIIFFGHVGFIMMFKMDLIIACVILAIFVPDFVVTIMFIVGGHKKNVKPIRVFYYFSIGIWIATILIMFMVVSLIIVSLSSRNTTIVSLESFLITLAVYFVVLAVQSYLLLLLRSEIIKLSKNCEFRFVNNAAEAACTMRCGDEVATEEADVENILNSKGFC